MNRHDFQVLSNIRVREGRILLENRHYAGAYYLLGYAVECAFKSCIAHRVQRFDFPDLRLARDSYTHDLEQLLRVSGLQETFDEERLTIPQLAVNWGIVQQWSEEARYRSDVSEVKARELYSAVTAGRGGVLTWLKRFW